MLGLDDTTGAILATRFPVEMPEWLDHRSAWTEHLPFAQWLVAAARPRLVVELGVHVGVSYCAFCEEVQRQGLPARCLGVDTFAGDEHAGHYDGSVLARLRAHHDPRHGAFSTLRQATFDAVCAETAPESVDLLHIDGLHTYEAARHDFETWLPKMSDRGIVLFHDTAERGGGFGVWQLWEEITPTRPHFAFRHGHGLGVLAVGPEVPPATRPLFDADMHAAERVRAIFEGLGARCAAATPKPPKRKTRSRFWPWR